jgi:hypothetical protein
MFGAAIRDNYHIDWSRLYAFGAIGDISMARTNYKCVANIYADFDGKLKPDWEFASDTDYYLNSIGAA